MVKNLSTVEKDFEQNVSDETEASEKVQDEESESNDEEEFEMVNEEDFAVKKLTPRVEKELIQLLEKALIDESGKLDGIRTQDLRNETIFVNVSWRIIFLNTLSDIFGYRHLFENIPLVFGPLYFVTQEVYKSLIGLESQCVTKLRESVIHNFIR